MGEIKFNTGNGLLKAISDFKDSSQERQIRYEIFRDSMNRLEVERHKRLENYNTSDEIEEERKGGESEDNCNEN